MIKFDKDVNNALKTLEKAGFETYAVGECVSNVMRGEQTFDWDLVTRATPEEKAELFPEGKTVDKRGRVLRIDYTYEVPGKEEDEPSHIEGSIVDIATIDCSIEDELAKEAFTVMAMADNPDRGFIDPYGGRDDLKAKLVRTISDADRLFKEEPYRMMEAVRIAAEAGLDLHKSVFDSILRNWTLLMEGDIDSVREEFERIIVSDRAGKGLNMLAGSGLMAVIVGEEVSRKMSASEMKSFTVLCENIDKTKPVKDRRLGLLYTCFSKKKGLAAIERMNYDDKTRMHLTDAMTDLISIQFLNEDKLFKRYLYEHGMERYNYLHNLSKAQRIVYDQPSIKIEGRNHMMRVIESNGEAVFVEDLVIDANDLMEEGIADSPERAEELLDMLMAPVLKDNRNNDRKFLLKTAKKYSKNKLAAKMRHVKWVK